MEIFQCAKLRLGKYGKWGNTHHFYVFLTNDCILNRIFKCCLANSFWLSHAEPRYHYLIVIASLFKCYKIDFFKIFKYLVEYLKFYSLNIVIYQY